MSIKLCRDCRTRQESTQFPTDKYGRVDTRFCWTCVDEHTPLLLTEQEAAHRLGITAEAFRSHNLTPAGSYSPPRSAVVPLYSRTRVDALGVVMPGSWLTFMPTAATQVAV